MHPTLQLDQRSTALTMPGGRSEGVDRAWHRPLALSAMSLALWLTSAFAVASPLSYLQAALDHSPEQRRAEIGIEVAEKAIEVAKARRNPQARGSASFRLDKPEAQEQDRAPERLNAQVVIDKQLFNLESEAGLALAQTQLEIARVGAEDSRQQVLLATYRAYLATALAAENLLLLDRRRDTLEEQLNVAESGFEVGKSTRLQVLNVLAEIAALDADKVSAENALVSAGDRLESVSGMSPDDILRLVRAPEAQGDIETWKLRVAGSPTARAASLAVQAQEEATRQIIASALPSLLAAGTASRDAFGKGFDTTFSLQLSVPIYSSGGATAAKRSSELLEESMQAAYESLIDQVELAASQAFRDLHQNKARTRALLTSVDVGRERLELAQASIELEAGILADALNAATDLAAAELQLAQARHGQMEAYLSLLSATGGLDLQAAATLEALFK